MPFPSAGCQTCKIRRIKCDETQPVCQRCMKSHRICYGMRAGQACSVLHIENYYASGEKKRPRGPRSTPAIELTSNLNAVPQSPLVELKTQAILYYSHYHLQSLKDVPNLLKGTSDDFMPTWMPRAGFPILDLAISSVALAVFSRTQQHPPAATEASITYQQLLRLAQMTIPSLHEGNIDACLLAIFFMSRYEDIVHRPSHLNPKIPSAMTLQCFSHHDGALAILKVWKYHLSQNQPATDIIKHTRRGLIKSALMRCLALPKWMQEGAFFGENGLELEYDRIVVQITSVRHRLIELFKKKKASPQRTSYELISTAEELIKEARHIDKALQDWTGHFPSTWCRQSHTLSEPLPWPTRYFYSPIVYSYPSPAYAAVWNQYYATRMLINSTCLRVLELNHPNLDDFAHEQLFECLCNMKAMTNDLASSLPFCLQRFGVTNKANSSSHQNAIMVNTNEDIKPYMARLTVWPLTVASSLREVDITQKLWFRSELAHLGKVVGVGILECAESDEWLQL